MNAHCKCGDAGKCIQCGRPLKCHVTRPCPAGTLRVEQGKPGLGDVVALWLERFGITPARVERFTGRPCGCEKRKRWLNQLGR